MHIENNQTVPNPEFNTPDAGRTYIAKLFDTVLRRHDYRQYISERLAGDFACTLAQHLEDLKARTEKGTDLFSSQLPVDPSESIRWRLAA